MAVDAKGTIFTATIRATVTGIARIAVLLIGLTLFFPSPGRAVTVTVDGTSYDIQFTTGESFTDNQALLLEQPWWGNEARAKSFRDAYYAANTVDGVPVFAWDPDAAENTDRLFFAYETLGPVPNGGVKSFNRNYS